MQLRSCYGPLAACFRPWELYDAGMSSLWCAGTISQLRLMKFHQKPFGLGLCNESFDAR